MKLSSRLLDLLVYGHTLEEDRPSDFHNGGWDLQALSEKLKVKRVEVEKELKRLEIIGKVTRTGSYYWYYPNQ